MFAALLQRVHRRVFTSTLLVVAQLTLLTAGASQPTSVLADPSDVVRWQLVGHIADQPIAWLAVPSDGLASGVLFARSAEPVGNFILNTRITGGSTLRSQDGGKTWQTVPDAPGRMVLAPGGTSAFSLGADAVYRSVDAGATWTTVVAVAGNELLFSPGFPRDGLAFLHAGDQLWRTMDGGQTWTNLDPGQGQLIVSVRLSPAFASDHTLFVGADSQRPVSLTRNPPTDNADSLGALVSTDAGSTWTSLSDGLQIDGSPYQQVVDIAPSPDFATDQTLYVLALGPWQPSDLASRTCADCTGPSVAVFRSHDAGASWGAVSQQSITRRYAVGGALAVSPVLSLDQTLLQSLRFAGAAPSQSGCGLSVSSDAGDSWQDAREPGQGAGLCSVGIVRAGGQTIQLAYQPPYYLSASPNRNMLHSLDGGGTWTQLAPPGDGMASGFEGELEQRQALLPDRIFQATQKGDLWEYAAFPPCGIQPMLGFGQVWSEHPDWQEQAGCPLAQEHPVQLEAQHQDLPGQGPTDNYWTTDGAACVHVYHDFQGQLRSGGVSASSPCSGAGDGHLSGTLLPFANGQYWLFVADRPGHGLVINSMRRDVVELNQ